MARRDRTRPKPASPPTTTTSVPGIPGANRLSPNRAARATRPTTRVVGVDLAEAFGPRTRTPARRCCRSELVPVSFGSSPTVTSIAAPKRNPVITAFDMNCEIQPIRRIDITRKTTPAARAIAATSAWPLPRSVTPDRMTALPATADSAALGPVESCRDVPNSAYRIVPAAAAYRPFSIGHVRDPGVPEGLRDHEGGDREPGDDVRAKPRAVVARRPAEDRDVASEPAVREGGASRHQWQPLAATRPHCLTRHLPPADPPSFAGPSWAP